MHEGEYQWPIRQQLARLPFAAVHSLKGTVDGGPDPRTKTR